jgi:hypothetical protein
MRLKTLLLPLKARRELAIGESRYYPEKNETIFEFLKIKRDLGFKNWT